MKYVLIVLVSCLVLLLTIPEIIKFIFSILLYTIENPWQVIQVTAAIVCIWILFEQVKQLREALQDNDTL